MSSETREVLEASHAPREEIDGVLEALRLADIECYEIPNSMLWGGGAVCIRSPHQHEEALQIVREFQDKWVTTERQKADTPQTIRWMLVIPAIIIIGFFLLTTLLSIF